MEYSVDEFEADTSDTEEEEEEEEEEDGEEDGDGDMDVQNATAHHFRNVSSNHSQRTNQRMINSDMRRRTNKWLEFFLVKASGSLFSASRCNKTWSRDSSSSTKEWDNASFAEGRSAHRGISWPPGSADSTAWPMVATGAGECLLEQNSKGSSHNISRPSLPSWQGVFLHKPGYGHRTE